MAQLLRHDPFTGTTVHKYMVRWADGRPNIPTKLRDAFWELQSTKGPWAAALRGEDGDATAESDDDVEVTGVVSCKKVSAPVNASSESDESDESQEEPEGKKDGHEEESQEEPAVEEEEKEPAVNLRFALSKSGDWRMGCNLTSPVDGVSSWKPDVLRFRNIHEHVRLQLEAWLLLQHQQINECVEASQVDFIVCTMRLIYLQVKAMVAAWVAKMRAETPGFWASFGTKGPVKSAPHSETNTLRKARMQLVREQGKLWAGPHTQTLLKKGHVLLPSITSDVVVRRLLKTHLTLLPDESYGGTVHAQRHGSKGAKIIRLLLPHTADRQLKVAATIKDETPVFRVLTSDEVQQAAVTQNWTDVKLQAELEFHGELLDDLQTLCADIQQASGLAVPPDCIEMMLSWPGSAPHPLRFIDRCFRSNLAGVAPGWMWSEFQYRHVLLAAKFETDLVLAGGRRELPRHDTVWRRLQSLCTSIQEVGESLGCGDGDTTESEEDGLQTPSGTGGSGRPAAGLWLAGRGR